MIRLHVPAVPHTVTSNEHSHSAFTGKVLRFCPMMQKRGFEVYHYGIETSEVIADKNIDLMTKAEWEELRILSFKFLHPELKIEEVKAKMKDSKTILTDELANYSTPLYQEFNKRLRVELLKNYRGTSTDFFCIPLGRSYQDALDGLNILCVEFGIGYKDAYQNYRIYESYCRMHTDYEVEKKNCQHYWFVIPHFFDSMEWPLNLYPDKKKIGYFGRIGEVKGCTIIVEIARRFPQLEFIFCGQGDGEYYEQFSSNIKYRKPIHGLERGKFLSSLTALLAPTIYVEPFGCISVEAQLCGTPVISNDLGGFTETIEPFKTGVLCHTLADFCRAVQMTLEDKFDRNYIRERAKKIYDVDVIGPKYEYALKSILEMHNGNNGWYSENTFMGLLSDCS